MATTADSFTNLGIGAETLTYTATFTDDSARHEVDETNTADGFDFYYTFVDQTWLPKVVRFVGYYFAAGGSHTVDVYVWDYVGEDWESISPSSIQIGSEDESLQWTIAKESKYYSNGESGGDMRIRFLHPAPGNVNHVFLTNFLSLEDTATYTWNNADGDETWDEPDNWDLDAVPGCGDCALIDGTTDDDCTLDVHTATLGDLSVTADYDGVVDCDSFNLNVTGDVTLAGSGAFDFGTGDHVFTDCVYTTTDQVTLTATAGSVSFIGTCEITTESDHDLFDVTFGPGTTTMKGTRLDVAGVTTVVGTLEIASGQTVKASGVVNITGNITDETSNGTYDYIATTGDILTLSDGGTIDVSTFTISNPRDLSDSPLAPGTYDSALVRILASVSGREFNFGAGTYIFSGDLTCDTSATGELIVDLATNNPTINISSDLTISCDGTTLDFNASDNPLTVDGDLAITETSGTLTFTTGTEPIEVLGNITIADSGNLVFDDNAITRAVFLLTGTDNVTLDMADVDTGSVEIDKASGTVDFDDVDVDLSDVAMTGAFAFNSGALQYDSASDGTFSHGDVTWGAGTVALNAATITIAGSFDYSAASSVADGTSTVVMTGTGKTLTAKDNTNLYNLTIAADATITAAVTTNQPIANALTLNGSLDMDGKRLDLLSTATASLGAASAFAGTGILRLAEPDTGKGITTNNGATFAAGSTLELLVGNETDPIAPGSYPIGKIFTTDTAGTWAPGAGTYVFAGNLTYEASATDALTITNSANPNFSLAANLTITDGGGTVTYTKGTGVITFTANATYTDGDGVAPDLEAIVIAGGTFTQAADIDTCDGFAVQSGATWDPGSSDLKTANGGDLILEAGSDVATVNLDGRTWTVDGNLLIQGKPDALLDMAASAALTINNVSGTNTAFHCKMQNVALTGAQTGIGWNCFRSDGTTPLLGFEDGTGNTGWTFFAIPKGGIGIGLSLTGATPGKL